MCNFWILFLYGESFQWITTIAHSPHYPSDTTLGPCTLSHTSSSFNMPSSINRTTPSTHLVLQLSHPLLHSVLGGSCESIPNATHALAHTPSLTHPRPLTHTSLDVSTRFVSPTISNARSRSPPDTAGERISTRRGCSWGVHTYATIRYTP